MKINIKKLSELSGFSAATVSNALNGKRGVNHETAQQILALAREYGYVPASRIQSIRLVTYRDSGERRSSRISSRVSRTRAAATAMRQSS